MYSKKQLSWRLIAAGLMMAVCASMAAHAALTDGQRPETLDRTSEERSRMARVIPAGPDRSTATVDRDEPFALDDVDAVKPSAARAIFSVGAGPSCDFANLNDALTAAGPGDVIHLSQDGDYLGKTYFIWNRDGSLTIRGGFSDCNQLTPTPSGMTTLNADGAGRVFDIQHLAATSFTQVNLENLIIRGGNNYGVFGGGGLMLNGRPGRLSVNLRNVIVRNNESNSGGGGGIKVRVTADRDGAGPMLTVDNDSQIFSNSTNGNGGGLSCESLVSPDTSTLIRLGSGPIALNKAENGGGISSTSCGRIFHYAGSSLVGVHNNEANDAGGAYYLEGDGAHLVVRADTFTSGGTTLGDDYGTTVISNSARIGGGLYARDDSYAFFLDVILSGNRAEDAGGAIYANAGTAEVHVRRIDSNQPCQKEAPGWAFPRCSRVIGNRSPVGAAFNVRNSATLNVSQTYIENNEGSILASVSGAGPGTINMESVLITGNSGGRGLSAVNGLIDFRWSTMVNNEFLWALRAATGHATHNARINAYSSVLWEDSGGMAFFPDGDDSAAIYSDCVIGWRPLADTGFTFAGYYSHVDPEFVSPADGDYRLGQTSPAIDYCDSFNAPAFPDLAGNSRGQPHQGLPLSPGGPGEPGWTFDLGAYEAGWLLDKLFHDRFE